MCSDAKLNDVSLQTSVHTDVDIFCHKVVFVKNQAVSMCADVAAMFYL